MKIIIMLSMFFVVTGNTWASSYTDMVESKRFERNKSVVLDTFSGITIYKRYKDFYYNNGWNHASYDTAQHYCESLDSHGHSDWRLPSIDEARYLSDIFDWTANLWILPVDNKLKAFDYEARTTVGGSGFYFTCIRGGKYGSYDEIKNKIKKTLTSKVQSLSKKHQAAFKNAKRKDSIESYKTFLLEYADSPIVGEARELLLELEYEKAKESNSINGYSLFINNYPGSKQSPDAIKKIYQLTQDENNIAGYQWFLKTHPDAKQSREALQNLHKRAFELADDIGTIASYNDFVIAYPFAEQVEQANKEAYALEEDEYSSFFTSDAKLSRALLVRSKQIERKARDGSRAQRPGYMLVVNRMNELLQEQFPAEEATLRYLESEEFKSFYRDFKRALNRIERKLADIRSNTSNLTSLINEQTRLMDNHFEKAVESREMSAELTKQHRFWERYLAKNE
ncbi:hypothetical protein U0358_02970 [Idiomarina sp. PL1-037]|uniref:hypothetical protein n=1 Tax=Idiomarina sp. PL1-037 TaxID=3095365 RepID=UPI002ACC2B0D|nr:hypothetical protein [Idiomarina sp. PL1-037]WQC53530.1 hypothetical protein U0358_02970 [Idiomarina sp. PL1-037]